MKKIILLLILITGNLSFGQITLPESRPDDLKITYTATKGLQNLNETIFISSDSSFYENIFQDISNRISFNISSQELDELYDVFKKYELDKISSKQTPRMAPERMGDNLMLQWGDNSFVVSNSGNFMIENNFINAWKEIGKRIKKFAVAQIDLKSVKFIIQFDNTLIGKRVTLYLNNEFLYDNTIPTESEQKAGQVRVTTDVCFSAAPGDHYLKVSLMETGIVQELKINISENDVIALTMNGNTIEAVKLQ